MQVCPRHNLHAQRPAGTRRALFLHAEEWEGPGNGLSLVWDGWDLRDQPFSAIKGSVPLAAFGVRCNRDRPLQLAVKYAMLLDSQGRTCGRISVELPVHAASNEDLDDMCVCIRFTIPFFRVDVIEIYELAPNVQTDEEGHRVFRQRWRILKPYYGLGILSALITRRNQTPLSVSDWPIFHDLDE